MKKARSALRFWFWQFWFISGYNAWRKEESGGFDINSLNELDAQW